VSFHLFQNKDLSYSWTEDETQSSNKEVSGKELNSLSFRLISQNVDTVYLFVWYYVQEVNVQGAS
jgi:hypothetical protein